MPLYPYQQRALDLLYGWFRENPTGNPCLVMPTGSGKSHVIAGLCQDALTHWPETRILMLTHVKELIEQNASKLLAAWPDVPMGVYSAGLGRRELGKAVTFAGIQSVRNRAEGLGFQDLIVVDECHLISHKSVGGYRNLIHKLTEINPAIRVVGLTATPYRLGHGLISEGDALFDALIEPISVEELIHIKKLAPLRSKMPKTVLDVSQVGKRGGEYIESDLQDAVNTDENNDKIVSQTINLAGDRKSWLLFCTGVKHARTIARMLNGKGIKSECVTGDTPKAERKDILDRFKSGELRAVTNANVLTTGFDHPDTDLVALMRPTMSPGLYIQMAGRGMRTKSHTDHCLVLDFAGVVARHGPIVDVTPPSNKKGKGPPPTRTCGQCQEICALSYKVCPACGFVFPVPEKKDLALRNDDIMGVRAPIKMPVKEWRWSVQKSREKGIEMLRVDYYADAIGVAVTDYYCIKHQGYTGSRERLNLYREIRHARMIFTTKPMMAVAQSLTETDPPKEITYRQNGKYKEVLTREWTNGKTT